MSSSPDRSKQPSNSSLSQSESPDELSVTTKEANQESLVSPSTSTSDSKGSDTPLEAPPLVPKRPLMRPVSRPQPPSPPPGPPTTPTPTTSTTVRTSPKPPVAPPSAPSSVPEPSVAKTEPTFGVESELAEGTQAISRQQPIPPPSEPKQYRAIGLLRGQYTPSEEQFTRGSMMTTDGTTVEAVLLGRVMSLVKNHLDLAQNHLWVVYPRTRDVKTDLHVQIVGVWEPEKLSKGEEPETSDTVALDETVSASEQVPDSALTPTQEDLSPGYDDDYFSVRGEVVFYSEENQNVIIKIQQTPRKNSSKAKAFKLELNGVLPSEKTLGYFWDLHVKREATALVITQGSVIGLVPPKKKSKGTGGPRKPGERKPPFKKRPMGGRAVPGKGAKPAGSEVPTRREALPKPSKRSEQSAES